MDESHYPHTYNPKMTLASVVTSGPKRATRSSKVSYSSGTGVTNTNIYLTSVVFLSFICTDATDTKSTSAGQQVTVVLLKSIL